MALDVIGVGFGRTGTESMKEALELLGFGPCHHMYEVLSDKDRYDRWLAILQGRAEPDLPALLKGYRSTVDWPFALYWRELAALFPDAKGLLTVRPADQWYASMDRTILDLMRKPEDNKMADALAKRVFPSGVEDRAAVIQAYLDNSDAITSTIGADRLLVYELGSGWRPLCRFLGCPEPDRAFPRTNEAGGFLDRDRKLTGKRDAAS